MDERSVAAHFAVVPEVRGQLTWETPKQLVFQHAPLRPGTAYEVVLTPGYRDAGGTVNSLRHHWPFRTEEAPVLTGSSPAAGDQSADPAAYLTLTFTRPMDLSTLGSAVSLSPVSGFAVRADPGDPRRVVLAPRSLLDPDRDYTIAVTRDARDVDGNSLGAGTLVSFHTGPLRPRRTAPSGCRDQNKASSVRPNSRRKDQDRSCRSRTSPPGGDLCARRSSPSGCPRTPAPR